MSKVKATGEQFTLSHDNSNAIITEVAAGLRYLELDGVQVNETYDADVIAPLCDGLVLVPWPNRIEDGKWTLEGEELQLDITEVPRGHAIHGLLRNAGYDVVKQSENSVTLNAIIFPQHGYPFHLDNEVTYTLDDDGLTVVHRVTNLSDKKAPVAIGTHPFFRVGDAKVSECTVQINADSYLVADPDHMIPTGKKPVEGVLDLRKGQKVGDLDVDIAWVDIKPEGDRYEHSLTDPDGNKTIMWADETMPFVHIYSQGEFNGEQAIAIEPMTAYANAFNTGENLEWVEPGDTFTATWGVQYKPSSGSK